MIQAIKKIELKTTTKYNYILRMLNGDKSVKKEDIEAYHSIMNLGELNVGWKKYLKDGDMI
jgi:hypothetical protein